VSVLSALIHAAAAHRLAVSGVAAVVPEDGLTPGIRSVVLLSPDEPAFWPHFVTQPENRDGNANPLDRWSRRVIGGMACNLGAKAWFPFGGPPWRPFAQWALRSGQVWPSPVGLLVDAARGLFVSWRGAVGLTEALPLQPAARPCDTCAAPCLTACPVDAFAGGRYDVAACRAHLDSAAGAECLQGGCLVRRSCPVGAGRRPAAQSAFHMAAFHPT